MWEERLDDSEKDVAIAQAVEFAEYVERQAKGSMQNSATHFLSLPYSQDVANRLRSWSVIDSAPKDGSWIMLAKACHKEVLLAYWHRLHNAWWGQGGNDGQWKKWQDATHWQPLPEPPNVP